MLRRRGYLVEQTGGTIKVSISKYLHDYDERIRDLIDYSRAREEKAWNGEFSSWLLRHPKELEKEKEEVLKNKDRFKTFDNFWRDQSSRMLRDAGYSPKKTKKNMVDIAAKIKSAIGNIEHWSGSSILIEPHYSKKSAYRDEDMSLDPIDSASVHIFKGSMTGSYAPDFTWFGSVGSGFELDDVLDAGDKDFFTDPSLEADYFSLVNELRHPGRSGNKILKLYTARPKQDRKIYVDSREVPSGIFLTSRYDSAVGIGQDLSGGVGRDIYLVKISEKHLIKTLDTPGEKQYQAFSREGFVPIVSIEMIG